MPETVQNGWGRGLQGAQPQPGRHNGQSAPGWWAGELPCPPPSDTVGQSVDVAGRWPHIMAGSGLVSGTVADVEMQDGNVTGGCDH